MKIFGRFTVPTPSLSAMGTTILNCRVRQALKYLAVVTCLLISILYLWSFGDTSIEHKDVWHRKSDDVIVADKNSKDVHRPNDLVSSFHSGGYKNGQNLVEKLRPKLVTRDPNDKQPHHPGEPIWNDLVSGNDSACFIKLKIHCTQQSLYILGQK